MTQPRLKRCPFCGEQEDLDIAGLGNADPYNVAVVCGSCQAEGPPTRIGCRDEDEDGPFDLEAEAVELWNERAT
jgi:Lar family restriction alleviation protein